MKEILNTKAPELRGSLAALRRAAEQARNGEVTRISARELAEQTVTPLWPPRDRYSKGCLL